MDKNRDIQKTENSFSLSDVPTSEIISEYEKRKEKSRGNLNAAVRGFIRGEKFTSN